MVTTETFSVYQNIIFELIVPSQPWCDPLFETRGATHCSLQHLLVWPIGFYNTSKSLKTRLIKWKQRPGIHLWFRNSVFWFPGMIKWKRPETEEDSIGHLIHKKKERKLFWGAKNPFHFTTELLSNKKHYSQSSTHKNSSPFLRHIHRGPDQVNIRPE